MEILIILGLITAIGADVSDLFAHSNNLQEDGYHYDRPVGYAPFPIYSKYDSPQSELLDYKKRPVIPQYEIRKLQPSSKQEFVKYETVQSTGQKPLQYVSKSDADKRIVPPHKFVGTTVSKFDTPKSQLTISKLDEPKFVIPKYDAAQQSTPKYDVPKFQSTKSLLGTPTPLIPKYEAFQPSLSKHNLQKPQSILTKYELSKPVIANPDIPRPFAPKYEYNKQDSVTTKYQVSKNQFTNSESPKPFSFKHDTFKTQIPSFATALHTVQPEIREHDTHEISKPDVPKYEIFKPKPITGKQVDPRSEVTNYETLNLKYETQQIHPLKQKLQEQTQIISKNDIFTYDKSKPPKTGELREDGYHYEIPQKIFEIAKPVIPATQTGQQKLKNEYSQLVSQFTTALPDITTKTVHVVTSAKPHPLSQSAVPLEPVSPAFALHTNTTKKTVVITPKPKIEYAPPVTQEVHAFISSYKPDKVAVRNEHFPPLVQQNIRSDTIEITPTHKPIALVTPQKPARPIKIADEHSLPNYLHTLDNVQPKYKPILTPAKTTDGQKPQAPTKIANDNLPPKKQIASQFKVQQTPLPFAAPTIPTLAQISVGTTVPFIAKESIITIKPFPPAKVINEYLPPQQLVVPDKEQATQRPIAATTPVYKPISKVAQFIRITTKPEVPGKLTNEYLPPQSVVPTKLGLTQRPVIAATTPAYKLFSEVTSYSKKPQISTKYTNDYLSPQKPVTPVKLEPTERPLTVATFPAYKPISEVTKFSNTPKKPEVPVNFTNEYLPPVKPVGPLIVQPTQRPVIPTTTAYKPISEVTKFVNTPKIPEVPAKFSNEYLPPAKPVVQQKVETTQRPIIAVTIPAYRPASQITQFSNTPKKPEAPVKVENEYLPPANPVVQQKVETTQRPTIAVTIPAYRPVSQITQFSNTPKKPEVPVKITNEYLPPIKPVVPQKVQTTQRPVIAATIPAYRPASQITQFSNTPKKPEAPVKVENEYLPPAKPVVQQKVETTQRPIIAVTIPAYRPASQITQFSNAPKKPEVPVKITNEYLPPIKPVVPQRVQTTQRPIIAATLPAYRPASQITQFSNTPKKPEAPVKVENEYLPPAKPVVQQKVETTQRPIIAVTIPAYRPASQITQFSNTPKKPEVPVKITNEYLPPIKPVVPQKIQTTQRPIIAATIPAYRPASQITQFSNTPKKPEAPAIIENEYVLPAKPVVPQKVETTQRPIIAVTIPAYRPASQITQFSNTPKKPEAPAKIENEYLPPAKPVVQQKVETTERPIIAATIPVYRPASQITQFSNTPKKPEVPVKITNEYLPPIKPVVPQKVQTTQQPVIAATIPAYRPASQITQFSNTPKKPEVPVKITNEYLPPIKPVVPQKVQTTQRPVIAATIPAYRPASQITQFSNTPKKPEAPVKVENEYVPPAKPVVQQKVETTERPIIAATIPAYRPASQITQFSNTPKKPEVPVKITNEYLPPAKPVVSQKVETTQRPIIVATIPAYRPVSQITQFSNTPITTKLPFKFTNEYLRPVKPVVPLKVETTQLPIIVATIPDDNPPASGDTQFSAGPKKSEVPTKFISEYVPSYQLVQTTQRPIIVAVTPTYNPFLEIAKNPLVPAKFSNEYLPPQKTITEINVQPTVQTVAAITTTYKPIAVITKSPIIKQTPIVTTKVVDKYLPPKQDIISIKLQTTPKPVLPSASTSSTYKSVSSDTKTLFIHEKSPKVNYDYLPPNRSPAVTSIPLVPFKAVTDPTKKPNTFDDKYIPPTQKDTKPIKVNRTQSKKPITPTTKSTESQKVTPNIKIINTQSKPESTKVTKSIPNKQIVRTTNSPILPQRPIKQFEKVSKLPAKPTNQARPLIQVSKSIPPGQPNNEYLPAVTKFPEPSHSPSALLKEKLEGPTARAPAPSYKPSQLNNEYLPPATKIPGSAHSSSIFAKPNPVPNKTTLVSSKSSIPASNSKQQVSAPPNPFVNAAITVKPAIHVIPITAKIEHLPTIAKSRSTAISEHLKKGYETAVSKPLLRLNPTPPLQTADAVIVTPNLPHQGYFYPNNPQPPFTF
ncbi:uncharacterized protein ACN2A1_004975 [Glossina fuscipes fuscipes]